MKKRDTKKRHQKTVYFASELYNINPLIGNAYLAEAIYERSHGRYLCILPQDVEPVGTRSRAIRDQTIKTLVSCDLALFSFDGASIEPATAVEFMYAKFADIPAVIFRSDLRLAGDSSDPWSLMASYYPRSVRVLIDGLKTYKTIMKSKHKKLDEVIRLAGQHSSADAQRMCDLMAQAIVRALDKASKLKPVMPKYLREEVYTWLSFMPGIRGNKKKLRREFERFLEYKVQKDLL
jgi:nucleoside 2-deoxyribosyltransferase